MDQNTWNGLTGKEVREKIQNIAEQVKELAGLEEKINNKADLIDGMVPANQLPSYVDDVIEGKLITDDKANFNILQEDGTYIVTPVEKSKIYIDIDANKSYRWAGLESGFREITNGDEIQQRLDNFNGQNEVRIENVISDIQENINSNLERFNEFANYGTSIENVIGSMQTEIEKHKFFIVTELPTEEYNGKVYYLNSNNTSQGLYYHNGTGWQRVGGLL